MGYSSMAPLQHSSELTFDGPVTAPKQPPRWMASEIVTILIGPDKTPFRVHKALLCNVSKFFANAFEGPYIEAQENTISLREERESTFEIFAEWLYTRQIPLPMSTTTHPEVIPTLDVAMQEEQSSGLLIRDLWRVVVFAEKWNVVGLDQYAYRALHLKITLEGHTCPTIFRFTLESQILGEIAQDIYSNTADKSSVRGRFIDYCTQWVDFPKMPGVFSNANHDCFPAQFLLDLLAKKVLEGTECEPKPTSEEPALSKGCLKHLNDAAPSASLPTMDGALDDMTSIEERRFLHEQIELARKHKQAEEAREKAVRRKRIHAELYELIR